MSASFQVDEDGFEHQAPMPDVPRRRTTLPERGGRCGPISSRLMPEPMRTYYERERPIEMRPVEIERYLSPEAHAAAVPRLDAGDRAAAGRSRHPPMRARLRVRHDAARHLADPPRPHGLRPRASRPRASTTRCGSTGRSGPTNGCSTRRTPRAPPARAAFRGASIFTAGRHPRRLRRPGRSHPRPRRLSSPRISAQRFRHHGAKLCRTPIAS